MIIIIIFFFFDSAHVVLKPVSKAGTVPRSKHQHSLGWRMRQG